MKRRFFYLLYFLGLLILSWFIVTFMWGWSPGLIGTIARSIGLAVVGFLSGAALLWIIKHSAPTIWLILGVLILSTLILVPPIFHEHEPAASQLFDSLPILGFLLPQLLPWLATIAAVVTFYVGLKSLPFTQELQTVQSLSSRQTMRRDAIIAFPLSALLLAGGWYHFYWLLVWDSTYDPIDVIFLIFSILVALSSIILLFALFSGKHLVETILYATITMVGLFIIFRSAKQVDYRELTEMRAEHISLALERYADRWGNYPDRLDQLAPWTILSIPDPVIMYGQNWCYQGYKNSYSLGYVDREHWSSPVLFSHEFKSKGPPTGNEDVCAAQIALMVERFPDFYGYNNQAR